jgi:hypothetical protein
VNGQEIRSDKAQKTTENDKNRRCVVMLANDIDGQRQIFVQQLQQQNA